MTNPSRDPAQANIAGGRKIYHRTEPARLIKCRRKVKKGRQLLRVAAQLCAITV
jgi:hypothetical protein